VAKDHRAVERVEEHEGARPESAWCETCGASRTRSEVRRGIEDDFVCRTCGGPVEFVDDEEPIKAPWHFKLLLLGTVGYLIYRLIWFIEWIRRR
jgi:hypothetical protein